MMSGIKALKLAEIPSGTITAGINGHAKQGWKYKNKYQLC